MEKDHEIGSSLTLKRVDGVLEEAQTLVHLGPGEFEIEEQYTIPSREDVLEIVAGMLDVLESQIPELVLGMTIQGEEIEIEKEVYGDGELLFLRVSTKKSKREFCYTLAGRHKGFSIGDPTCLIE